ncbi:MAG: glycosyltransferase family 9 protein [Pseudomonadota bacterium]
MTRVEDVLVIHQGALGDLVCAFPALSLLKNNIESASLGILCESRVGALTVHLGIVDHYLPLERACFASLFSSAPSTEASDIIRRYSRIIVVSFSEKLVETLNKILPDRVTQILPRHPLFQKKHVSDFIIDQFCRKGVCKEQKPLKSNSGICSCDVNNSEVGHTRLWIHPGSGSRLKAWPIERFCGLYELIKDRGLARPCFILGPAELHLMDLLKNDFDMEIVFPSNLVELAGLLAQGRIFIGNDSGVSHLAAFIGLSVVAIFGPSDPARWSPRGRDVTVMSRDMPCAPCFEQGKKDCKTPRCFLDISVDEILSAIFS